MTLGLNSWTTGDGVDLRTDIRVAAAAGYDVVEIKESKIDHALAAGLSFGQLRGLLDDAGIIALNVNTLDQATLAEGAALEDTVARCRRMCDYAAELGASYVIVGPTYLAGGQARNATAICDRTLGSLARFATAARASRVRIAFEFHGYDRASINTLAETVRVLDLLDDPDVVSLVDTFHFYVGGSQVDDLRALRPDRLAAVHLADVDHNDRSRLGRDDRVLPGRGVMNLRAITAAIQGTGYQGAYSVELFRPDYWAMDPAIVADLGIAAMRSVL